MAESSGMDVVVGCWRMIAGNFVEGTKWGESFERHKEARRSMGGIGKCREKDGGLNQSASRNPPWIHISSAHNSILYADAGCTAKP